MRPMPFVVRDPDGNPVGRTVHAEDAAALVALQGDGGTVTYGAETLWREGLDSLSDGKAGESYDSAAETMYLRKISR